MPETGWRLRASVCYLLGVTFAAVLGTQSVLWASLSSRLLHEAAAYPRPLVPRAALPWIERTPLQHWGTVSYLAALQGHTPERLLLFDPADRRALRADPPLIPVSPWDRVPPEPGPGGWFDYRPLVRRMREPDGVAGTGAALEQPTATGWP